MPFDWREYLDLAGFLRTSVGSFSQEAALRSAVSRAYYGAFCHVRNFARDNEAFVPTGTANDHKGLRDYLRSTGRGRLAQQVSSLRDWRNRCDYDDDIPNLGRMVVGAMTLAQQVVDGV